MDGISGKRLEALDRLDIMWYTTYVDVVLTEAPVVVAPDGRRIVVPVDPKAIAEMTGLFNGLPRVKQDWLITRFPFCDSDVEATRLLRQAGEEVDENVHKEWKHDDALFRRCYDLLSGRMIDWAKYIAMSVEAGNAILGALENRRLIARPWAELSAREATAKEQAIQTALDRVVGRKQEVDINVKRIEELVPREG